MTSTLIGNLIVALQARGPSIDPETAANLVGLINNRISPPQPLTPGQVHVRSLRVVSDAVNDHGGRFPSDEHEHLCALLVDSPVLIGHDRSRLPVARNFAARTNAIGDRQWVQVWFYWMRGEEGDRLAADIDGGVIKEGSIGFEFRRPQCSICSEDIRRCEHIPGAAYRDAAGQAAVAHYEYREITRVLETSLVYRGATPDTRLGNESLFTKATVSNRDSKNRGGVVLECRRLAPGRYRTITAVCDDAGTPTGVEVEITTRVRRQVGDRVDLANPPMPVTVHEFYCGRQPGIRR